MGRIAIVTGAASGIGLALARALVQRRAHVVLADIDGAAVARVATALASEGPGSTESARLDVRDAEAVAELVNGTHERHGAIHLLCNNAGIGIGGWPEELTLGHWERAIDVNIRGVVHGCHVAYPLMLAQGFGHILNTASLAGLLGGFGAGAPYAMSKHAVVGLSLALRTAGADAGVKVHALCPGGIDTPIWDVLDLPDLPTPPSLAGLDMRSILHELGIRRLHPPGRLAEHVLREVGRNRAIIVAPRKDRLTWYMMRAAPETALALSTRMTQRWRAAEQRARAARAAPPEPTASRSQAVR